ncbi:type II toxin-antitoxin system VapC family toxin [Tsukamurella soli]|uniref:Ribonuclease VapC n=1 Tax=Tsukamurella soli TaxID=644556 RepID=A0ABP8J6L8_9ACTN
MIYLDTSAMVKLLVAEEETADLRAWLDDRTDDQPIGSDLCRVEIMRVALRHGGSGLTEQARFLLDGFDMIPLTESVITLAETIGPPTLRSLDAIHLAAAKQVESELTAFVTYDHRLRAACDEVGLYVASPGTG